MASRRLLTLVLAVGALGALAAPAAAVLSGKNGRIVFASGRDGTDATAHLYFLPVPSSVGGGTVSPAFSPFAGGQYRHPTWSPDRTKIAYAQGTPGPATTEDFDIYIHDLTTGSITPITNTGDGLSADRPAWSPDGTRIAYEHQPVDNSTERDIRVQTVGTLAAPLDLTSGVPFEGKPAWTPDSQTIYYAKFDPSFNDLDIVKEPAGGGTVGDVLVASGIDEFQPSISPDGSQMCFTTEIPPNDTSKADVYVTTTSNPGFPLTDLSDNAASGDYNCTWSPDGQFIAYVQGTFSNGALMMERSDDTSLGPITLTDVATKFDGNPDWAPDGRPLCPDSTISTTAGTPVTIPMDCVDTGPQYERTPVKESIANDGDPQHGTVGQVTLGDPSTVVYTPNQGFTGQDSLQFIGFDDLGFGSDRGTVTISVNPPGGGPPPTAVCGGKDATIVGTEGSDVLKGTNKVDVIAGLGGNDTINGGRGNDIVCGGSGRDRVGGGAGSDRVSGGSGNDRASGNSGNDRVAGGSGNDRVSGGTGNDRLSGNSGRDTLFGGIGRDRLNAGSGRDRLDGGANQDVCKGGPSRDSATRCERSFSVEL